MTTKDEAKIRRERISLCIQKGMHSPVQIANNLKKEFQVPDEKKWLMTINNDIKWFKKQAMPWLDDYGLAGFVFETRNAIEQLKDIEMELQEMRQKEAKKTDKDSVRRRITILSELRETINTRWVVQGEGPTLMNLQRADKFGK